MCVFPFTHYIQCRFSLRQLIPTPRHIRTPCITNHQDTSTSIIHTPSCTCIYYPYALRPMHLCIYIYALCNNPYTYAYSEECTKHHVVRCSPQQHSNYPLAINLIIHSSLTLLIHLNTCIYCPTYLPHYYYPHHCFTTVCCHHLVCGFISLSTSPSPHRTALSCCFVAGTASNIHISRHHIHYNLFRLFAIRHPWTAHTIILSTYHVFLHTTRSSTHSLPRSCYHFKPLRH
jgi:hypothetical protein